MIAAAFLVGSWFGSTVAVFALCALYCSGRAPRCSCCNAKVTP